MGLKTTVFRTFIVLFVMAIVGLCTRPLAELAMRSAPVLGKGQSAAKSAVFSMLGGYRNIAASLIWVSAYVYWEREDIAKCMPKLDLAVALEPGSVNFWNMGAMIIAFDSPHWIFSKRPTSDRVEKNIRLRQGKLGLEFINRGIALNPKSLRLRLTKSIILEKVFDDKQAVLKCYEDMMKLGKVPIFVVRNYARSLEDVGKVREALQVLEENKDNFDKSHPAYQFYLGHIQELKNKLNK